MPPPRHQHWAQPRPSGPEGSCDQGQSAQASRSLCLIHVPKQIRAKRVLISPVRTDALMPTLPHMHAHTRTPLYMHMYTQAHAHVHTQTRT